MVTQQGKRKFRNGRRITFYS